MSAPSTVLTLADLILPDGCWTVDTAPIVAAAVAAAAGSAKERQRFPRFILRVDGQAMHTERADTLAKWLREIKSGETCRVWRNGGKGATIDFDA